MSDDNIVLTEKSSAIQVSASEPVKAEPRSTGSATSSVNLSRHYDDLISMQKRSESGDPDAQFELGLFAIEDAHPRHFEDGMLRVAEAAIAGHPPAVYFMRRYFTHRRPMPCTVKRCARWSTNSMMCTKRLIPGITWQGNV